MVLESDNDLMNDQTIKERFLYMKNKTKTPKKSFKHRKKAHIAK